MATAFYGTMSISEDLADNLEFKPIWQAALDSYDEDKLEWGITSVYGQDPEDGQVVYAISGSTPDSFDDEVATCLCGSLSVAQAGELMEQLEAQKAIIAFDIYEYDADEDQLTHERCKAAIAGGEAVLSQTTYEDEEVTSKRLCDLGFADESEMDDEELAVMLSAEHPDGPEADDLVDAIEDVRNDERHQGVFTQQETSDPVAFSQMIEAATADEGDVY